MKTTYYRTSRILLAVPILVGVIAIVVYDRSYNTTSDDKIILTTGALLLLSSLPFLYMARIGIDDTFIVGAYCLRETIIKEKQKIKFEQIVAIAVTGKILKRIHILYDAGNVQPQFRFLNISSGLVGWEDLFLKIVDHVSIDRLRPSALSLLEEIRAKKGPEKRAVGKKEKGAANEF